MSRAVVLSGAVTPIADSLPGPEDRTAAGSAFALAAFLWWGVSPIYFRAIAQVPALEVLSHRIVWSVALLFLAILARRRGRVLLKALQAPRTAALLFACSALIGFNWFVFIWAIQEGHLLECSLGYFINPLVSIALGVAFLRERLWPARIAALSLAAISVAWLAIQSGRPPWISLALAVTFGLYGLLRKVARIEALEGLFVETLFLLPAAIGWLLLKADAGTLVFGTGDLRLDVLLSLAGVVTAVPLLCFTAAARRLTLTAIGFFQYLAPSCQALLAVLAFGEPFSRPKAIAFAGIWTALALVSIDSLRRRAAA